MRVVVEEDMIDYGESCGDGWLWGILVLLIACYSNHIVQKITLVLQQNMDLFLLV